MSSFPCIATSEQKGLGRMDFQHPSPFRAGTGRSCTAADNPRAFQKQLSCSLSSLPRVSRSVCHQQAAALPLCRSVRLGVCDQTPLWLSSCVEKQRVGAVQAWGYEVI